MQAVLVGCVYERFHPGVAIHTYCCMYCHVPCIVFTVQTAVQRVEMHFTEPPLSLKKPGKADVKGVDTDDNSSALLDDV